MMYVTVIPLTNASVFKLLAYHDVHDEVNEYSHEMKNNNS